MITGTGAREREIACENYCPACAIRRVAVRRFALVEPAPKEETVFRKLGLLFCVGEHKLHTQITFALLTKLTGVACWHGMPFLRHFLHADKRARLH